MNVCLKFRSSSMEKIVRQPRVMPWRRTMNTVFDETRSVKVGSRGKEIKDSIVDSPSLSCLYTFPYAILLPILRSFAPISFSIFFTSIQKFIIYFVSRTKTMYLSSYFAVQFIWKEKSNLLYGVSIATRTR